MSEHAPDPRFLGGESFVLTNARDMAVVITITHDGVLDAQCHVSKTQAATWLRQVADLWEADDRENPSPTAAKDPS